MTPPATVADALRHVAARFAAISPTPRLDAELLMAHALDSSRERLLLLGGDRPAPPGFAALADRRMAHEPIAYIVGRRDFWTIDLAVGPGVLIPRPDSETLIEAAVAHFAGGPGPRRILDLGTGSGALLLAALAEWPGAEGVGVDISADALAIAEGNARRLGLDRRARFEHGGWRGDPAADLVLCNPPYVETGAALPREVAGHEPAGALYAGADGLDEYRRIAPVLAFAAGGIACVEIGHAQAAAAGALFRDAGFRVAVRQDLAGKDRCLLLTYVGDKSLGFAPSTA